MTTRGVLFDAVLNALTGGRRANVNLWLEQKQLEDADGSATPMREVHE